MEFPADEHNTRVGFPNYDIYIYRWVREIDSEILAVVI